MAHPRWFFKRAFFVPLLVSSLFVVLAFRYYSSGETPGAGAAPDVQRLGTFTISDNVNLVLLDVSVKGPKGGFVSGLQKGNFQVFEDGHAREITHFANVDTPVSIGLVVDNSGSMRAKKP